VFTRAARLWRRWFAPATLGARGEAAAARHLRGQGYHVIAQGQRNVLGEIDLIAVDPTAQIRMLVFVEVKTRADHETGHPAEAVDRQKQQKLTRLATAYRQRHALVDVPARFDVIAVTWPTGARSPAIEHFKNAFDAQGDE